MRGEDRLNGQLFSYIDMESRIHEKHPLRLIREVVNGALAQMSGETAIDARTLRHAGYKISQTIRKRIEEIS